MIIYRMANADDSVSIARLQAESWRHRYRGIFRDEYLDGPVFKDRRRLWVARLDDPPHLSVAARRAAAGAFAVVDPERMLEVPELARSLPSECIV